LKKQRFAAEQISAILKRGELGIPIGELIRQVGVSQQIFYLYVGSLTCSGTKPRSAHL
jgi:hypothetical protein